MTDDDLQVRLRDILNRYDRPRDISQEEALTQIAAVYREAGYVLPTAMWQAFYRALHGLKTGQEWIERFEKAYDELLLNGTRPEHAGIEAARRAAGLAREAKA